MPLGDCPITVDVLRALEILSTNVFASPESCIRELLANAADSLHAMSWEDCPKPEIRVFSEVGRVLTVSDNGIGMSESDVRSKLGTVFATSKRFNEAAIGRFGIGFYSCFPLCRKVEVITRTRDAYDVGTIAVYTGGQSLKIQSHQIRRPGTVVKLYLKEEYEYLVAEGFLAETVHNFCNFVQYPIFVGHGAEPVNAMDAAWYYQTSDETLRESLNRLMGIEETLAVFPVSNDPDDDDDYYDAGRVRGVLFIQSAAHTPSFVLLSRRILVTETDTSLLDETLRAFLSGIIDAEDLPLVLSRDTALQKSSEVEALKYLLLDVLADGLVEMANTRREDFRQLMAMHGSAIKKACVEHPDAFYSVKDYLPYRSSLRSSVTLADYLSGRGDHTVIFADDMSVGASLIPLYNQANIEVLYMTDRVDRDLREGWVVSGKIIQFKRLDVDPPQCEKVSTGRQQLAVTDASALELLRLLFSSLVEANLQVEVQSLGSDGPPAILALSEDARDTLQMTEVVRMHQQQGSLSDLPTEIQDLAKSGVVDLLATLTTKTLILNESNDVVQVLVYKLKGPAAVPTKTRWLDRAVSPRKPQPGPMSDTRVLAPLIARFLYGQALLSSGLFISAEKRTEICQNQTELISRLLMQADQPEQLRP